MALVGSFFRGRRGASAKQRVGATAAEAVKTVEETRDGQIRKLTGPA